MHALTTPRHFTKPHQVNCSSNTYVMHTERTNMADVPLTKKTYFNKNETVHGTVTPFVCLTRQALNWHCTSSSTKVYFSKCVHL